MRIYRITLTNEKSTIEFGTSLAVCCQKPCIIYLHGDLGVGKTTFCRGFLRGLGYTGNIKSPTYTLIETYKLNSFMLYHFDLYRLIDPGELEFIGIREYINNISFCLVEWPEHGKPFLPIADIILSLFYQDIYRKIKIVALTDTGRQVLAQFTSKEKKLLMFNKN